MTRPMIITSYLGPTNFRPSRVSAAHNGQRATVEWDHGLDSLQNHAIAAEKLVKKIGFFNGNVAAQAVGHDDNHYYFIAVPKIL